MANPIEYFNYETVNDLQSSKKQQLKLLIFVVFVVALLTIPYWRRLFCKAGRQADTPLQDAYVGGEVTNEWIKSSLPYYVDELNKQLIADYSLGQGAEARCTIYAKIVNDLSPNQVITLANAYKNKKCKTIRQAISNLNWDGCGFFGTQYDTLLLERLNRLNIS